MNNPYLELFESVGTANTTRRKIEIFKDITRLGRERGLEVEIALEAANVSRRHAEIRKQDNSLVLVDLGSFNGTFLNGRRVAGAEILNDKDVIQLGPAGPATWSFDEMKRLSSLEVLRAKDEDAQPAENNDGRGLYKQVERENDQNIEDSRKKIEKYKADAEKSTRDFKKKMEDYQKTLATRGHATQPASPQLGPAPEVPPAKKVPDDLTGYVDFLHPWGGHLLDMGILVGMILAFSVATIIVLRSQDV